MELIEQLGPIANKVMGAQGLLLKLPVDLMAASVECVSEAVHEVQRKTALAVQEEQFEGGGRGRVPGMREMACLGVIPLAEFAKLPRNVCVAGMGKLTESWRAMKRGTEDSAGSEAGGQNPKSQQLIAEGDEVWADAEVLGDDFEKGHYQWVLWQIGRPGRREYDGEWTAVFDYHLGEDTDEINCPGLPSFLAVPGGPSRRGSTEELNIHFALDRDYGAGSLALIYERWGAERNRVTLDGNPIASVGGAGCGRYRRVAIGLPGVNAGEHILSLAASGETEAGGHGINFLKLLTRDKQT